MKTALGVKLDKFVNRAASSFSSAVKREVAPTLKKSKDEIKQMAVTATVLVVGGYLLMSMVPVRPVPPTAPSYITVNIENLYLGVK